MKLWLLRPRDDLTEQEDPWWNRRDMVHGFVIYADSEAEAREIAHQNAASENQSSALTQAPWLNPKYSTCKQLLPDVGMEGVIIRDYVSG
jgi:hypothetical protein